MIMDTIVLPNLGYIRLKVPTNLFNNIKEECMFASSDTHASFNSSIEKRGTPTHYWLRFNRDPLRDYVSTLINEYVKRNDQAISMIFNSDGVKDAKFTPDNPWMNIQRHGEFLPNHDHYGFLSYNIWINIPSPCMFEFVYNGVTGVNLRNKISLNRDSEGTIIMFPSKLVHCTYPHYNTTENRISVAGNIILNRQ